MRRRLPDRIIVIGDLHLGEPLAPPPRRRAVHGGFPSRPRVADRRVHGERRYVVLGHTHHPEACAWSGERSRVVYLNPGAWQSHPEGLPRGGKDGPSFVWLARHAGGAAYVRHRIFTLGAVSR